VTPVRDEQSISDLVDRIVREANVPTASAREELRRELIAHFEEAGQTRNAIDNFGSTQEIAAGFRRAYSRSRLVLYAGKVLASIAASAVVALGFQAIVNLRLEPVTGGLRLGPWYTTASLISIILVFVAVTAWELGIEPLCARLERRPARLLVFFVAFAAGAYVTHLILDKIVEPEHAALGSAATIAVWISTIAILSRFELAFIRRFGAVK
jgi:hypothetical protein